MADGEILAPDLEQETAGTLDGSEEFVMFDAAEGKRASLNVITNYITGNKANLHTTEKGSIVGAINEVKDEAGDLKEDINNQMYFVGIGEKSFVGTGSAHSSNNDRLSVVIKTNEIFHVTVKRSTTGSFYHGIYAFYTDGTSSRLGEYSSNNVTRQFTASKDIEQIGLYSETSSDVIYTFTVLSEDSIAAKASRVPQLEADIANKIDSYTALVFGTTNTRINQNGVVTTGSTNDAITAFYPCSSGQHIKWHGKSFWYNNSSVMSCVAFYRSDMTFISSIKQVDGTSATTNQVGDIEVVAPAETAYVAASSHDILVMPDYYMRIFDRIDNIDMLPGLIKSNANKINQYFDAPFSNLNKRYDYSDKTIVAYIGGQVTNYIPCSAGDKVEYYGASLYHNNAPKQYCIAFLAFDYTFIDGVIQVDGSTATTSRNGYITRVAPEGTAYVIGSNNATTNVPYLHVYSYEQILSKDSTKREELKAIIQKIKMARHLAGNYTSRVTFLHFSDLHHDLNAYTRIVSDRIFDGGYVDDAICTGDYCADENEQIADWWNPSIMLCIGNHDVAKLEGGVYDWAYLSMAERYTRYIAPYASTWGITVENGKSYYYKDYSIASLRFIVLDTMLYNLNNSDASDQETWFANLLDDAIAHDLHVLVACHSPHGGAVAKPCSFSKIGQGTMPTYTDCNTPQSIIDIVSAKIVNGLHFCGYLVGHTHQDNIWDAEDNGKQLMYCVTTSRVNNKEYWKNSDQYRDNTLDAYNIVTVDTRNTLVKIIRGGGADMDDKMRPRKMICFNYSTGEIIGEEN